MSTCVRRSVASTPQRTAMETWMKISSILAPDPKCSARAELEAVAGVAASSISSEAIKNDPIVVYGGGLRVHVYGIYGEDAVSGDGVEEEFLSRSAVEDGWKLSLPVPKADLDWSQRKLKTKSTRVIARAMGDDLEEEKSEKQKAANGEEVTVNSEEFLKS